jgi:hypothetical protein
VNILESTWEQRSGDVSTEIDAWYKHREWVIAKACPGICKMMKRVERFRESRLRKKVDWERKWIIQGDESDVPKVRMPDAYTYGLTNVVDDKCKLDEEIKRLQM